MHDEWRRLTWLQHRQQSEINVFCVKTSKNADCFLPSALRGPWYSSTRGILNFTDDANLTYIPTYSTSKFGNLKFSCYDYSGNNYVFKSESFSYLGLNFEVYTCFVLTELSDAKYTYYEGTVRNSDADNDRLKSELASAGTTPSVASVCDRTSIPFGGEFMLLKNDGNELDAMERFPFDVRGTWQYNFTSGGNTFCANDSSVDICLTEAAKTMVYDYTKCSTIQAYSANGILKCMHYTSDDNYMYMNVYNTDDTTDESTTYRFTCYVISITGTTMYATQYPQYCDIGQTATNVSSTGATIVLTRTAFDTSSTVLSTASAAGIAVGLLLLIIIIVCGVLIWYYYKKRKQRDSEKAPLQKAHPANKRLANGSVFVEGKGRGSRTPRIMNGDTKYHIETDPGIRRENSIHISMTSRQGSGLNGLDGDKKHDVAPVEEPEVNYLSDDVIVESETEVEEPSAPHESTFLPITPHERSELHFTDDEIRAIERRSAAQNNAIEEVDNDMDRIDDELGLPRLSRAFTPIIQPEEPTLPLVAYKKKETDTDTDDGKRPDGIKKVKLKKKVKKKRVQSAKGNIKGVRPGSMSKSRCESMRETPFLERIKKQEQEKTELEQREKLEKEMRNIENEVIKARLSTTIKESPIAPSSKYLVDGQGNKILRSANKRASIQTSSGTERRRFGDPPAEYPSKNRKRTPRIRHPMEVQGDGDEDQGQGEGLKKAEEFWKEEKRARSGRKRDHPEALTIPSLKEDPFDHRDDANSGPSTFPQARSGKSSFGMRPERESSAFFEPTKDVTADEKLWQRASHLWHLTNRPLWHMQNH
ncbi:hypothetical protein ACF0H5_011138 [Mactra antiquata]